ncbi:MAG: AsmA-like C-terminal region-containing protein [Verrucomicrobiota bacterium]
MRLIRQTFIILCVLVTIATLWAGIYTRREGFTQSWRRVVEEEFEKRGYHVGIRKITLGAFRGLVAEDVVFYRDATRVQELAVLNDIYLDVDLSRILSKEVSLNTLDVDRARLALPIDPNDPSKGDLVIEELSGRIAVTESVIEILKTEAVISGVEISVQGSLLRPPASLDEEDDDGSSPDLNPIQGYQEQVMAALATLEQLEFLEGRPRVEIEFRGDLKDLATTTADLRIDVPRFRKKGQGHEVASATLRGRFDGQDQRAVIEELSLTDDEGQFVASGEWSRARNQFTYRIESDADVVRLVNLFVEDKRLGEVVFFSPPVIQAEGNIELDQLFGDGEVVGFPGSVMGELSADRLVSRGKVFTGASCGFSLEGERFYIRNLRLDHKSGIAFLNLKYDPALEEDALRFQTEVKMDPLVFRPFFDENGRKFLDAWGFDETSTVYLALEGVGPGWDASTWSGQGILDLRNFRLKGVPFSEMECDLELAGKSQWYRDVSMQLSSGTIRAAEAHFDGETRMWSLDRVVADCDIIEGSRAFSPPLSESLKVYRFETSPEVRISGTIDGRRREEVGNGRRRGSIEVAFESDSSATYEFFGEEVTLLRPKGRVLASDGNIQLRDFSAGALGGELSLDYNALNVRDPLKPFEAVIQVSGIRFEELTALYGRTDAATGLFDARFDITGNATGAPSINGTGQARIREGNLFALPLMAPLQKLLRQRSDEQLNVARQASATFRVADGVLYSDDLEALTEAFRVRAAGWVSMVDETLEIEAVVSPRAELSSALTTPISELLTYSATGKLGDAEWKPKHISNLAKLPATVISEVTNIPLEGLRKIGQSLFGSSNREMGSDTSAEAPGNPEDTLQRAEPVPADPMQRLGNRPFGSFLRRLSTPPESDSR